MIELLNVEDMSKEELVELLNMVVNGVVILERCCKCGKLRFKSEGEEKEYDLDVDENGKEIGGYVEFVCLECLKN